MGRWRSGEYGLMRKDIIEGLRIIPQTSMHNYEVDLTTYKTL